MDDWSCIWCRRTSGCVSEVHEISLHEQTVLQLKASFCSRASGSTHKIHPYISLIPAVGKSGTALPKNAYGPISLDLGGSSSKSVHMIPKTANIGIFAHIDAGKTTFTERILFETGEIPSPGSVEDGTTESDTLKEEIERGISITSSTVLVRYKHKKEIYYIYIIDTPGHLDFSPQVDSALLAVEFAVILVDVTAGIRSQTEAVIEKIKAKNIPYLIFLNKSDRSMEYTKVLSDVGSLLGRPAVPMFYRTEAGEIRYSFLEKEVNEDIELSLIEWDEKLTGKYFSLKDKKKIILQGMSSGFRKNAFVPAFLGSALNGNGVREFLDFISIISRDADHPDEGEFIAFKRQNNPHLGQIVYFKSNSRLRPKDTVYRNAEPYAVHEILQIVPGGFQSVHEIFPGSIFVLQDSSFSIGERLYSEHIEVSLADTESGIQKDFSILLEPDSDISRENLEKGIHKLVWEDQGLACKIKEDTGQLELFGIGELHLEIAVSRLKEIVQENFSIKSINVAKYGLYKNMVKKLCFEHSTFDGKWKSGKVHGFLEARTDLQSYVEFDISLEGILKDSITSAFSEFSSHGWEGLPVLGMNLRVVGYEAPEIIEEHTPSLIKIAVISGLKSVLPGTVVCIGPVSFFEIHVPQNYTGNVISLLNKRHAKVTSLEVADDLKSVLKGEASADNLLGFTAALRNMTQGKGFVTLNTFFKYDKFSKIAETTD